MSMKNHISKGENNITNSISTLVDIFSTEKKYDLVYSDPPWAQKKGNMRKVRPNQGKPLEYPVMPLRDIKLLHGHFLRNHTKEIHNVFIWTIDKFIISTEEMMRDLGYLIHARIVWDKGNGVAPAFTLRFAHEYLLWFYPQGKMLMPVREMRGKYTDVLRERSKRHSQKPACAYEMLESLFPETDKIELFARSHRTGWDCWGNDVGSSEYSYATSLNTYEPRK